MQLRSQSCQSFDVILRRLFDGGQEIDIGGFASDSILLGHDKSAKTTQLDRRLGTASAGIAQLIGRQASEQIPVPRKRRSVRLEPTALSGGHGFATKGAFAHKPGTLQLLLDGGQLTERRLELPGWPCGDADPQTLDSRAPRVDGQVVQRPPRVLRSVAPAWVRKWPEGDTTPRLRAPAPTSRGVGPSPAGTDRTVKRPMPPQPASASSRLSVALL